MGTLDSNLIFCEAQAVTATGDTASTNQYDTGNANGSGDAGETFENLWITAVCTTTATSGGSATVQAVLQNSADDATWTDVVAGKALAVAAVLAGTVMLQVQPPPGMLEYWRIAWRVGVAVLTAGNFDAWGSNTIQYNVSRNSGFTVL